MGLSQVKLPKSPDGSEDLQYSVRCLLTEYLVCTLTLSLDLEGRRISNFATFSQPRWEWRGSAVDDHFLIPTSLVQSSALFEQINLRSQLA